MAKRKASSKGPETGQETGKARAEPKPKAEPVKKTEAVYQLKITLRDVRPPIWRRVQVEDCTLVRAPRDHPGGDGLGILPPAIPSRSTGPTTATPT